MNFDLELSRILKMFLKGRGTGKRPAVGSSRAKSWPLMTCGDKDLGGRRVSEAGIALRFQEQTSYND